MIKASNVVKVHLVESFVDYDKLQLPESINEITVGLNISPDFVPDGKLFLCCSDEDIHTSLYLDKSQAKELANILLDFADTKED